MKETIGRYHPRHRPIPDGWRYAARLLPPHDHRYIWIEPVCAEPHNGEVCANPHGETDDGKA